jgi:hypothetical protein
MHERFIAIPVQPAQTRIRRVAMMDGMGSMMGWMMGAGLLGWVLVIALLVAIVIVLVRLLTERKD